MERKLTEVSFEKGVKGLRLNAIERYVRLGAHAVTGIVLARLISPLYFGLVGLALFFSNLIDRSNSFRLNAAFLHKQEELTEASSTHFTLSLIIALFSFLAGVILFYTLAGVYSQLVLILMMVLSLRIFVVALGRTSQALLQKRLKFKPLAISGVFSVFSSTVISIFLALRGYPFVSLIVYHVLERVVRYSLYLFFSSWKPRLRFNKDLAKYFLGFSGFLFIGSQFDFLMTNFNQFMVGTFISATTLAFYNKAYQFTGYSRFLAAPLVSTLKPVYAQSQDDPRKLSRAYYFSLAGITHLSWPVSVTFFLLASSLITLLIGTSWLPVVPLFRVFLLDALFVPLVTISNELCIMVGEPKTAVMAKAVQVGVLVPFSVVSIYVLPWGIGSLSPSTPFFLVLSYLKGVTGATLGVGISALVSLITIIFKYLPENISIPYKRVFLPPIIALILSLGVYYILPLSMLVLHLFAIDLFSLLIELLLKSGTFLGLYFLFLFIIQRKRLLRMVKRIYEVLF